MINVIYKLIWEEYAKKVPIDPIEIKTFRKYEHPYCKNQKFFEIKFLRF